MSGFYVEFQKSDTTGKYVRGWASVVSENGAPVQDWDGDMIGIEEVRKAAHAFVTNVRVAKAMHRGQPIGEVVESVVIDDEFAKSLGITDGKRGWWIGMAIHDETIQKKIRDGDLRAFSIGGKGRRAKAA